MTPSQLSTFKVAINANTGSYNILDHGAVAAYFNASAGAGFYWRSSLSIPELNTAIDWAVYSTLSVAAQNTYLSMTQSGTVDVTSANIRGGFSAVFPNSGTTAATFAALVAIAKKVPTRFEALFVTANLTSAPSSSVTPTDVAAALAS